MICRGFSSSRGSPFISFSSFGSQSPPGTLSCFPPMHPPYPPSPHACFVRLVGLNGLSVTFPAFSFSLLAARSSFVSAYFSFAYRGLSLSKHALLSLPVFRVDAFMFRPRYSDDCASGALPSRYGSPTANYPASLNVPYLLDMVESAGGSLAGRGDHDYDSESALGRIPNGGPTTDRVDAVDARRIARAGCSFPSLPGGSASRRRRRALARSGVVDDDATASAARGRGE